MDDLRISVLALVAGSCLAAGPAPATVFHVNPDGSGDYPTIREAIQWARDGDVIELGDGVFTGDGNRDLIAGAHLTIRSGSGDPARCVIDCEGTPQEEHWGFLLLYNTPTLEGITITRAYHGDGGAVAVMGSAVLTDCVLSDNFAYRGGGGLWCEDWTSVTCTRCVFERNRAWTVGGGMHCYGVTAGELTDCTFIDNETAGGYGGAINSAADQPLVITGCTFVGNHAELGGAIAGRVRLLNCTFASNRGDEGSALRLWSSSAIDHSIFASGIGGEAIACWDDPPPPITCCDIFGNEGGDWVGCLEGQEGMNGNFSADPLFCDLAARDLRLRPDSPCAPEQNPACGLIGALPVGCGPPPVPVLEISWGRIKAIYRSR